MTGQVMNESEWFAAVYLAHAMLELHAYPEFHITKKDLNAGAMQMLKGLIDKHDGGKPELSKKTREIISLIQAHAVSEVARTGGGRH
jgi:hypothetical protein